MGNWKEHDEVVASTEVGSGVLGSPVPEGTKGEVVDTRTGLFDSYATVKFDNGYTEEVKTDDLKRHTWW